DETCYLIAGFPRNGSGDVYFIEGDGDPTWRVEHFANRLVSKIQQYRKQGRRIIGITCEDAMAGQKGAWRWALQNYFHDCNERMPAFISLKRHAEAKVRRTPAGLVGRLVT